MGILGKTKYIIHLSSLTFLKWLLENLKLLRGSHSIPNGQCHSN